MEDHCVSGTAVSGGRMKSTDADEGPSAAGYLDLRRSIGLWLVPRSPEPDQRTSRLRYLCSSTGARAMPQRPIFSSFGTADNPMKSGSMIDTQNSVWAHHREGGKGLQSFISG